MSSTDGVIFFALLVVACVIGMIAAMLGSDRTIEDLYGLPPVDKNIIKANKKYCSNKYLKKGKTYGRRDIE